MADDFKGITQIIGMIPRGGKFAKSVVNFVHKANQNWPKLKTAIQQIDDLLKQGKLKLDGKQKTIFESNKNILKNHEKVTKKVELPPSVKKGYPPFNTSKEDFTKGWTPTVYERQNLRKIYIDKLNPPARLYTKEMEAIDEELNELMLYQRGKYRHLSEDQREIVYEKLQAKMKELIDVAMKKDLQTLSLSEINKKSHDLQKRIREIADNPNIKGTVYEGPKKDMIAAIYDSENAALTNARQVITKKNSELKYGKKYPVLDPDNDAFIIIGLDERGHPIKIGRFTGRFSATKDSKTGDLSRAEGTSFYDKWNSKTGKLRKEGEEVFHETLNREGKVIMSNPEYKLPKTQNLDMNTEFYTDLSTSDLAKKGYSLKQIDMIRKGREARKYLEKTESPDVNIRMHEQTSTNEIGAVMEDLYNRGDDVYKMSMEEWVTKIPEYFAGGGRVAYGEGTGGISNFFKNLGWEGIGEELRQERQMMKIAFNIIPTFTYPDHVSETTEQLKRYKKQMGYADTGNFLKDLGLAFTKGSGRKPGEQWAKYRKFLEMENYEKANLPKGFATGGVSNLFRQRQGFRTGNIAKLPEFLKFVEKLLIKASNEIRQGIGKWKGLTTSQRVTQHDNLTKLATEFQKTKKFDVRINEYTGIDAEKAFVEAQAKVKAKEPLGKIWKSSEGETEGIAMGFDKEGIKALDYAMKQGTALSDAMKKMGFDVASMKDTLKFDKLVSEGMSGFSREMKEQILRAKYGDVVSKELLNQMLTDTNPQRLAEVMGTIDEGVIMHGKGMGTDEIITTLKESFKRRPNVEGGLIPGYATGGVSNLFRSR